MTRARDVGGASVTARRLLILAGAVAGFWLVSWLTSGHADAATPGLPDPVGAVVRAAAPGVPDPVDVVRAAVPQADHAARPAAAEAVSKGKKRAAAETSRPGAADVVAPIVAGPVSRAAVSPVRKRAAVVAAGPEPQGHIGAFGTRLMRPVAGAVEAAVHPLGGSAGTAVEPLLPIVRSAEPVARAAGAVVAPVTETAAGVVKPVSRLLRSAEPVVSTVARPAAGLVDPLTGLVRPVTADLLRPVLNAATPVLTGLLTPVLGVVAPVVDGIGRPIVAPVADVVGPPVAGSVLPPAHATAGFPPVLRQFITTASPAPAMAMAMAVASAGPPVRPVVSGPACAAIAAAVPHRGVLHTRAQLGKHAPADSPAPARPGAPVSSDAASGAGSTFPPAFLAAGHLPHGFRASTQAHGDFVPLWRPCEPGTGPG